MPLAIRTGAGDDDAALVALARADRFARLRGYRALGHDFAASEAACEAQARLREPGARHRVATCGGSVTGWLAATPLAFESDHFGVAMAGLAVVAAPAEGADRVETLTALVRAGVEALRERGADHASLRIDIEDAAGLEAAQRAGFRLVDTLVTFVAESGPPDDADTGRRFPGFHWRGLARADFGEIAPDDVAHFAAFMRERYRIDRFHADRRLAAERAHEMYVEWFRRVFSGEWADGVQLIGRAGRWVGFCSFQKFHGLAERTGVPIIGRGLAAVLPEGKGGYALLAENISTRCPVGHRYAEFDTQIQNFPVINVWIRRGMRFLRGQHTLHRWLDA